MFKLKCTGVLLLQILACGALFMGDRMGYGDLGYGLTFIIAQAFLSVILVICLAINLLAEPRLGYYWIPELLSAFVGIGFALLILGGTLLELVLEPYAPFTNPR